MYLKFNVGCFEVQQKLVNAFRFVHFYPSGELYLKSQLNLSSSESKVTFMYKFIKYPSYVLPEFVSTIKRKEYQQHETCHSTCFQEHLQKQAEIQHLFNINHVTKLKTTIELILTQNKIIHHSLQMMNLRLQMM
jgi:hypothetical protein